MDNQKDTKDIKSMRFCPFICYVIGLTGSCAPAVLKNEHEKKPWTVSSYAADSWAYDSHTLVWIKYNRKTNEDFHRMSTRCSSFVFPF